MLSGVCGVDWINARGGKMIGRKCIMKGGLRGDDREMEKGECTYK